MVMKTIEVLATDTKNNVLGRIEGDRVCQLLNISRSSLTRFLRVLRSACPTEFGSSQGQRQRFFTSQQVQAIQIVQLLTERGLTYAEIKQYLGSHGIPSISEISQ